MAKVPLTPDEQARCCVPAADRTHARRCEYVVKPIPFKVGVELISQHHYAKGAANTAVKMIGLVRCDGEVVGAAQFLPPTKVAAQSVAGDDWRDVLSFSRMVVLDSEPTNAESLLIGGAVHEVKKDRRWRAILTYADQAQQHTGTIYKATNFEPLGVTKPECRYVDEKTGRLVAKKATHSRTKAEMIALGCRVEKSQKFKFVMFLDRALRKRMADSLGLPERKKN
ncbi:MAG: hypothetical protein WC683_20445 [bacterium]